MKKTAFGVTGATSSFLMLFVTVGIFFFAPTDASADWFRKGSAPPGELCPYICMDYPCCIKK